MRLLLILLFSQYIFATEYYVATTGNDTNNGTSTATPFLTIQKGIDVAVAGDIVWVKAGAYGDVKNVSVRSGTIGNPIKIIGYTTTKGDIAVVDNWSSYTYANIVANVMVLPSNIMPLIETVRGADNDPDSTDKAFVVTHSYVWIENIMTQYQEIGFDIQAANVTLLNVYSNEVGNWNPANPGWNQEFSGVEPGGNLNGYGIRATSAADNLTIKSSSVYNAGADAIFIVGADDHVGEYNSIYANKSGNSTDYMYVLYGGLRARLTHNRGYRYLDIDTNGDLPHHSRGLAIKCLCQDAIIDDFYIYNTRFQLYLRSDNNTIKNLTLEGSGESFTGELIIADNSNNNEFYNTKIINGSIQFNDYNGSDCADTWDGTGSNNIFVNTIIDKAPDNLVSDAFINIQNAVWNAQNATQVTAGTQYFYGATFVDGDYFIKQDRPFGTLFFYNLALVDVTTGEKTEQNAGSPKTGTISYNYVNADAVSYTVTGTSITTLPSAFTNKAGKDFTLSSGSGLRDIGTDTSGLFAGSNTDFLGNSRSVPYDIGAYEFGGVPPPVDPGIFGGKSKRSFFKLIN